MVLLLPLLFFLLWFFIVLGGLGLWIWGLVDALTVPADTFYRSGTKLMWGLLIGLLGPIAAVVYLAVGRPDAPTRQWIRAQKHAGIDLRHHGWVPGPGQYGAAPGPPQPGWAPVDAPSDLRGPPGLPTGRRATTPEEQWWDDRQWLAEQDGAPPAWRSPDDDPDQQAPRWG